MHSSFAVDFAVTAQSALDGNIPPRHLLAPRTVLSPGPRLAGTPSRGKEEWNGCNERSGFAAPKWRQMAVFGKVSGGPRDAIENEFFGWQMYWRIGPGNLARSWFVRAFEMAAAT
jgi:hypothetical protein